METLRRAIRNIAAQLGAQAVTWSATLLFTAALGRYLGDAGFGVLFLAYSYTTLFAVFVEFGLDTLVTREVARQPDLASRHFVHALVIKLVLWAAAFAVIQVSAMVLEYPETTRQVLFIYSLAMGLDAVARLMVAVFRGLERMGHPAISTIVDKGLSAAVGIVLLTRGAGVIEMAWVYFFGVAARLAWNAAMMRPHLRRVAQLDVRQLRPLLGAAAPFVVYSAMQVIYWRIDAVMLSKMTNEAVVGWYGAGYRLFDTLYFLPHIVSTCVMMPILSRLSKNSLDMTKLAFAKGLNVLLLAGIPISTGLAVLASPILQFIYHGPEFQNAAPALQALAVGLLLTYVNAITGWLLVSLDLERRMFPVPLGAAVLNVILNLFLIPHWQHVGAAVATSACEAAIAIAFILMLPKGILSASSLWVGLKAAAATAGMTAVLLLLPEAPLPILVGLGAIVYTMLVLALRAVPGEELALLWQALRGRRSHATVERVGSS